MLFNIGALITSDVLFPPFEIVSGARHVSELWFCSASRFGVQQRSRPPAGVSERSEAFVMGGSAIHTPAAGVGVAN